MPRFLGVDLPREKRIDIALTYLYGVGRPMAAKILAQAQVDPALRAKEITDDQVTRINSQIVAQGMKVEGDLRREISQNIRRLIDINSYRGLRHRRGLPVRGQRTHTNARTRKGPRQMMGARVKKTATPVGPSPKGRSSSNG